MAFLQGKGKNIPGFQKKVSDALVKSAAKRAQPRVANAMSPFGGVSQVSAAPVSIGNTIRSVGLTVKRTSDGVIACGRDFVQIVGGTTGNFNNWTLQAGMSLSPIALNASALRGYFQSHQEYRFLRVCAHYITSSPTSLSGDVMVMYHANHGGPKVDHTSNNFMAYALSTASTVLGPQWTNHSVEITPKGDWLGTDVLNAEDVEHQADGEILVYTKNTTNGVAADAPGYFLLDYEVEFKMLMTNPRIASIPSSVFKWFPTAAFLNAVATAGDPVRMDVNTATTYSGLTGAVPPGTASGTIFQIVLDFQSAVFGLLTPANLATMWAINQARNAAGTVTGSLVYPTGTGTTLYGVYRGTTLFDLYPSYPAVFAGNSIVWTNTLGAGNFVNCAAIICAVGSINNVFLQANLG
jgi:hypothetical protein